MTTSDGSDPTTTSIGSRLRDARKGAGLTQEAVATELGDGFSSVSLYRWENGRELPSVTKVARLAELYGVSIDWLAGRTPFREVFRPGKVVVDPIVIDQVQNIVDGGGQLEDLPASVVRHPGIDYAWTLPAEATLLDAAAAEAIERRTQQLLAALTRRTGR